MRYRVEPLTPAGTTRNNPIKTVMSVLPGDITEVEIYFPPGSAGLLYVQVYHGEHQIYPTTPGSSFRGDDTHITIEDRYRLMEEPLTLSVWSWSPLATLEHVCFVSVTMRVVSVLDVWIMEEAKIPEGWL